MIQSKFTRNDQRIQASGEVSSFDSVGRTLKARYDHLVEAPLPERVRKLLAELTDRESALKRERIRL